MIIKYAKLKKKKKNGLRKNHGCTEHGSHTQEAGFHATPVLVGLRKFLSEFFFSPTVKMSSGTIYSILILISELFSELKYLYF